VHDPRTLPEYRPMHGCAELFLVPRWPDHVTESVNSSSEA